MRVEEILKSSGGKVLNEFMSKKLVAEYGISVPNGFVMEDGKGFPDEVEFPAVLKILDEKVMHKSDVGGVMTNISSREELVKGISIMRSRFPGSRLLVERMVKGGLELIIGTKKDSTFGTVIMLGMGGIYAELYADVSFRTVPLDQRSARDMIQETSVRRFISGFRGVRISEKIITDALLATSRLALELADRIDSMDINPLIVSDQGAFAADVKIVLQ